MEVTLDPGSDSKVSAIRVALRPDTEFSNLPPPAEGAESADLTDDEINEFVAPRVESLLNLLTKRLHDGEGKLEPQGFEVEVGGPPLSFPEVLEGLRTHLAAMRNLLAEAALKFPLPHRKT